jgi:5-methylcytosine-specific restriction protein B
MDAEYYVEADGGHLALIMESRSGMSGTRAPRNTDYNRALTILLGRLGMLNAVLVDALVDSRYTQALDLPETDRKLIQAPVRLAVELDADALRRHLGTKQAKVAQAPDATKGGNSTKRIRLRVDIPGFVPGDADRLAQALAAPGVVSTEKKPDYWWEHIAGENVWMEITGRQRCPRPACG